MVHRLYCIRAEQTRPASAAAVPQSATGNASHSEAATGRLRSIAARAAHNGGQCARENFSCTRNSSRELNQARDARRMGEEKLREQADVSSLLLDIEQDVRRSREWLCWRVCDDAER